MTATYVVLFFSFYFVILFCLFKMDGGGITTTIDVDDVDVDVEEGGVQHLNGRYCVIA